MFLRSGCFFLGGGLSIKNPKWKEGKAFTINLQCKMKNEYAAETLS
jgi:hypothetical protein